MLDPSISLAGESFFDAGRSVTDLLTRNFLKAYGVWWYAAQPAWKPSQIRDSAKPVVTLLIWLWCPVSLGYAGTVATCSRLL